MLETSWQLSIDSALETGWEQYILSVLKAGMDVSIYPEIGTA
jgi:hypothetical protein